MPGGTGLDAQTWNEYQERVTALVQGYRVRGHRFADLDPLGLYKPDQSELSLERFGLAEVDPDTHVRHRQLRRRGASCRCARSCAA